MIAAGIRWGNGRIEQDCSLCSPTGPESEDERAQRLERRVLWGCDAPSPKPWATVDCTSCPDPRRPLRNCAECNGTGHLELHDCPWRVLGPDHWDMLDAVSFFDAGVLPVAGGWHDQAAPFVDGLRIVMSQRADYERQEHERLQREAERKAARRNR